MFSSSILRPYQTDALAAVLAEWERLRATLVVSATGTGKTIMFLALLDHLRRQEAMTRALVLVHKIDLTTQPLEKAARYFSDLSFGMGIVQAARNDVAARVIVSTVQSLTPRRLELIQANGPVSHIVVDEAHHAVAPIFAGVIAQFPEARVVGFTATPIRADERGLRGVFQSVAYRLPIRRAIAEGALVPPKVYGFGVAGLGDDLAAVVESDNFLELVLAKWREHCAGRPTVAFTSTIEQARRTAEYFRDHGVPAAHISGQTPKRERETIRQALAGGGLQVVANAQVWTEGTDIPEIGAMLILRHYKPHDGPFIQMVGRGLRPAEGKSDCIILDFNPRGDRNLNLEGDLLGDAIELEAAEADQQADEAEGEAETLAEQLSIGFTIDPARLTTLVLDYLKFDALDWYSESPCYWMAGISSGLSLWIVGPDQHRLVRAQELQGRAAWTETAERAYQHIRHWRLYAAKSGFSTAEITALGVFDGFEAAKQAGDDYALDNLEKALSNRTARWRSDAASDGQIRVLRGLGKRKTDDLTKGQASNMITWRKCFRSVEHADRTAGLRYVQPELAEVAA